MPSWRTRRKEPYTELGLKKFGCIRCGCPATTQWQICSDGNNYRPLCTSCDIRLNEMVLKWMDHPKWAEKINQYKEKNQVS